MFTDVTQLEVRAGKGGDGRLGFRHEKYRAKGGPDGGDGGHGGSVILEASHNQNTLSKYRNSRVIEAEDGQAGGSNRKAGKGGEDAVVPVPVGTTVLEGDEIIADLAHDGQQAVIAKGGRGGFGNAHFVSSTRQTPHLAEKGEPGERRKLTFELRLVADVGLVGLPNAGKSTLLSVITNAKPEIADYPFTTLVPNLGVVDFENNTFLAADIPGLIEGASQGKGLGDEFLRHVERTAVVLHLISADSEDITGDYQTIINELKSYKVDLTDRPQLVVLTKIETVDEEIVEAAIKKLQKVMKLSSSGLTRGSDSRPESENDKMNVFAISSVAHRGMDPLLRQASQLVLEARRAREEAAAAEPKVVISQKDFPNLWQLAAEEDGSWRITGGNIEGFGRRTDWDNPDAVERMRDILRKVGVAGELARRGVEPGAIIRIGPHEFEWL